MGNRHPSPAPPCPHTPGSGLAAFRTSPSLDWVSPVAPAENTIWSTAVPFLFLDFSSNLSLHCTLGFYSLSGPPHCDLTVCLPQCLVHCSRTLPQPLLYSPCTAPASNTVIALAIPLRSPVNHSTILCECLTRSVSSTTEYSPVHGCPYVCMAPLTTGFLSWCFPYKVAIHNGEVCGYNWGMFHDRPVLVSLFCPSRSVCTFTTVHA